MSNKTVDKYKCNCDPNSILEHGFGTNYNEVTLEIPDTVDIRYNRPEKDKRKTISVDACLADELKDLWSKGIRTTGCCCGHNIATGFIHVEQDDIPKMRELGYRQYYFGGLQHDRRDTFLPASLYGRE